MGLKPWEFWELRPADLPLISEYQDKVFQDQMWRWRETQTVLINGSDRFELKNGPVRGRDLYKLSRYDDIEEKKEDKKRKGPVVLDPESWERLVRIVNSVN